jgi:outer membrane receptor protein involved in Fe transport
MKPATHILISILLFIFMMANTGNVCGQTAASGMIYGKISTDNKKSGLAEASIQLFQYPAGTTGNRKTLHSATLSSKKGEFVFNNLDPAGLYAIHIQATGFVPRELMISFTAPKSGASTFIRDLGNIKLEQDNTALDTVNINSSKQLWQLYPDKKVFNLDRDLSSAGATSEEVLKNIPGIIVDINGNLMVRNTAPQIFIDGRPTTLLLSQIPAEQIERIELMTNASAKYDASSAGGIVNIILRKNKMDGYNGSLRAGIDRRGQPLGGADINIKKKQVNIFGSAQYNARKSLGTASASRLEYLNSGQLQTSQQNAPENKGYFGFGRAGLDVFLNNRTTLTASGNYGKGYFKVSDLIDIARDSIPATLTSLEYIKRTLDADIDFTSVGALVALRHNFAQPGKEITSDFSYNSHTNDNTSRYHSRYFDANGAEKNTVGAELATGRGVSRFYTFQTDFTHPGPGVSKFESGIRAAARNYESFNKNYRETPAGSREFSLLPATGVEFNFDDVVFAAYGNYSNTFKSLSYQVGMRLESSFYQGELINKNQQFKTDYPLNLFPSIFLSQKINDRQSLQVNYSRKINRPNFFQILPFVDFSDSLNLNIGNPALLPEFSNIGELLYQLDYKNSQAFFATAYIRQSSDLITRYQYKGQNTDPSFTDSVIYNSFANAGSSYTYGLELISKNRVGKNWEILTNINLFDVRLNAGNLAGASNQAQKSWFGKMVQSWRLPADFSIQLSADYQARTILPPGFSRNSGTAGFGGGVYGFTANISQGYVKPIYGMDLSIKKDLFKDKSASISLQVNDILRTRTYETVAASAYFNQENFRRRDPQLARLNFSWRFGKLDAGLERRRNSRAETENMPAQQ